jgi:RNA polymerase sigma factor (sigma-70 family)
MSVKQLINDNELVQSYISGNEASLTTLIHRHKGRIFGYILQHIKDRDIAEDIFQDTFIKIIHTLKRGQYKEEGKFLPWVLRIAHNLVIDHFRKENKMPTISFITTTKDKELDIFSFISDGEKNREEAIMEKQLHADLRRLVEALPDDQKEMIKMRLYEDLSFKEIAELTHVSINTALGRMRYAIINIRKMIKEQEVLIG